MWLLYCVLETILDLVQDQFSRLLQYILVIYFLSAEADQWFYQPWFEGLMCTASCVQEAHIYKSQQWLSACLHFMSLKMKFIYSIITHFSKLFPHCQHNLLPSALMAAQLWMVDGYLIGKTILLTAPKRERKLREEVNRKKEYKITSQVEIVQIHRQILDSVGKCFHLWDQSCNYFQTIMSTSLSSLVAGLRQNKTRSCIHSENN